jgi:hypothetical protein
MHLCLFSYLNSRRWLRHPYLMPTPFRALVMLEASKMTSCSALYEAWRLPSICEASLGDMLDPRFVFVCWSLLCRDLGPVRSSASDTLMIALVVVRLGDMLDPGLVSPCVPSNGPSCSTLQKSAPLSGDVRSCNVKNINCVVSFCSIYVREFHACCREISMSLWHLCISHPPIRRWDLLGRHVGSEACTRTNSDIVSSTHAKRFFNFQFYFTKKMCRIFCSRCEKRIEEWFGLLRLRDRRGSTKRMLFVVVEQNQNAKVQNFDPEKINFARCITK